MQLKSVTRVYFMRAWQNASTFLLLIFPEWVKAWLPQFRLMPFHKSILRFPNPSFVYPENKKAISYSDFNISKSPFTTPCFTISPLHASIGRKIQEKFRKNCNSVFLCVSNKLLKDKQIQRHINTFMATKLIKLVNNELDLTKTFLLN